MSDDMTLHEAMTKLINPQDYDGDLDAWYQAIGVLYCEMDRDIRERANLTEQTRTVMGQDDDGTPNGKDYTERRFVSEWKAAEHHDYLLAPFFPVLTGDTDIKDTHLERHE